MGDSEDINAWGPAEGETAKAPGYAPESLVACPKCARANSPLRLTCIYCGEGLPVNDRVISADEITLRPPADWEKGFNLIVSAPDAAEERTRAAATLLRQPLEEIELIIGAGLPVPIARTATRTEAVLVETRLTALGFITRIVSDKELTPDAVGFRLVRAMEFGDDGATMRTSGANQPVVVPWTELALLVRGRFRSRRTEMNEVKGKRQDMELVDVRELTSDEAVMDLYARDGWSGRITASGFNFSCLGAQKTFATAQNFELLVNELRQRMPDSIVDETYQIARRALELAWPLTQRNEAMGWKRMGLGKVSTDAALVSDNEQQFTRYSRLRYWLAKSERSAAQ